MTHEKDLKQAASLTIMYTRNAERKHVKVSTPAEVKEVLQAFNVTGTREGQHPAIMPFGTVEFHFADGSKVQTAFVRANELNRDTWGELFVDETFYQKINELASRHAGTTIDVLTDNT